MRRRTQIAHSHPKIVSWIPTGYLIRGNKKKAEAFLMEQRQTFQLPAEDTEAVEKGELFADYLERWLKIAKSTIAITTYSSYDGMMKSTIVPWFRKTGVTITELTAQDIQDFYTAQLARVKSNTVIHYHALIHRALKRFAAGDQSSATCPLVDNRRAGYLGEVIIPGGAAGTDQRHATHIAVRHLIPCPFDGVITGHQVVIHARAGFAEL